MIPCSELRTGNIIMANNRLRKVTMISDNSAVPDQSLVGVEGLNHEENENYLAKGLEPVPMSEIVLQQCHFNYLQYFKFWQLICTEGGRREMDINSDYDLLDFMRRPVVKKIASLHQLQNIYYMLFNKELDFDLDTTVVVGGRVSGVVSKN